MKVSLHLDNRIFKEKPDRYATSEIHGRITNEVSEVTPKDLAEALASGKTAVLATMKGERKKANMIQQQVLMLDFDNKDDETKMKTEGMFYTSIDDVLTDEFVQQNAAFLYKTFSHTEDWDKFRLVFVLDQPLKTIWDVYGAYQFLLDKYPNADISCKDPSRLFFGGTEYIEINFDNVLNTKSIPKVDNKELKIVERKPTKVERARKSKPETGEVPTYKLMKQGNKEAVKARLSVYGCKLPSKVMAVNYLKSVNMAEFLGIEYNPFFDLFHYEENPSASIFKMDNSDIYLYKCHSASHQFTGDIVLVISKLLGISYTAAVNYLIEVTGIEIELTENIKALREQCDLFSNILLSEDLKKVYPAVHQRFDRYKQDIISILTIFKENLYEDENGELRSLTWISVRRLSEKLYGTNRKYEKVSRILNLMTYTNWIDKLDESSIPTDLLEKIKATQMAKKRDKRSNVFELLLLGDDFFFQLNKKCEAMHKLGFTMQGFSKEYVERTDGKEKASKVYVQDKDKKISVKSEAITQDIHKIALRHINKHGYILEKDLIKKVQRKWKSKGFTEYKYKQAVSELLQMYDLQRKRLTKDLKQEFGLTKLPAKSSPAVLIRAN
ncbi:hypothetical protein CHCC15075_1705 [Bacillus licheniformis]|uniref:hypothetical protein n=1 Tax=Bacillus TaxID=1386 RepID=UPI000E741829|nr:MULTISPECIES: hypothetical protein [Bacillus]AYC54166.1 hypothetical protein C7M53_23255 [Bacillus licheniformis]MDD0822644.1 hypothetical protein [Bacillus cereus]MED1082834.1 hypothetical protein [Bacillus licheniformis]TWL13318.1 hypothetical protein CHCC16874_1841 [Bacillus licheniformis]TWM26241.1 hypothetical protein CHCC15075_1705 [Bacillus licheniformis]